MPRGLLRYRYWTFLLNAAQSLGRNRRRDQRLRGVFLRETLVYYVREYKGDKSRRDCALAREMPRNVHGEHDLACGEHPSAPRVAFLSSLLFASCFLSLCAGAWRQFFAPSAGRLSRLARGGNRSRFRFRVRLFLFACARHDIDRRTAPSTRFLRPRGSFYSFFENRGQE